MFRKGFTLVELLVVISILATLSALIVPNLMNAREKARDAKRKSDLRSIEKALELYRQDHNPPSFPSNTEYDNLSVGDVFKDSTTGVVYLEKMPGDPLIDGKYYYSASGLTYTLAACLENKIDVDVTDCPSNFSTRVGHTCSTSRCYVIKFE